jgi:CDP-diacylglycerol---serine O-phosphatidyltransferase
VKFVRNIPNFITLGNLLCGAIAVVNRDIELGCYLIIAASVLDFLDGLAARALQVSSPLGRELDSLADVVSFGLAPAVLLMAWVEQHIGLNQHWAMFYFPLVLPMAAAWRLARFNVDTEQSHTFKGLPAPGNGLLWVGILLSLCFYTPGFSDLQTVAMLYICTALSALIMVSKLKLMSFKFKHLGWKDNAPRYTVVMGAIVLGAVCAMASCFFLAIPLVIGWYIAVSLVHFYLLSSHEIQS